MPGAPAAAGTSRDILLTTFTRGLAEALDEQLGLLIEDGAVRSRIDVVNVDRLAYRVVAATEDGSPNIIDQKAYSSLWREASRSMGSVLSASFLQNEWEQVILAQSLPDRGRLPDH